MGQDPDAIRQQIEETRSRMDDTVGALGYKADVPSRTKEAVHDRVQGVKDKVSGVGEAITGKASNAAGSVNDATPSTGDIKRTARKGAGLAQENPLGLAIGSVAVGFIAGLLLPATQVENEKLGPMADQVKDQIRETGQEALEHGKAVASDVAGAAQEAATQAVGQVKEQAQSSAQEHGSELKDTAQENAQSVTTS